MIHLLIVLLAIVVVVGLIVYAVKSLFGGGPRV